MNKNRFVCDTDNIWNESKSKRAIHPDAIYLGDKDYGNGECVASYKCPHCNKYFEVELAQ